MALQLPEWASMVANPMEKMEKAPMKLLVLSEAAATMGIRRKGGFPILLLLLYISNLLVD